MSELVVAPRATTTALQYSSLKYCVAVFKEEAIAAKWFVSMKCTKANLKHRIAFLRLKLTVSFFSISWKAFENTPKALKFQPFVLFRAKSWFRINGREKISGLTLPTFCRLAHNVSARPLFKASFWGLETKASPHFEDLKTNRKNWASVIKEKPREKSPDLFSKKCWTSSLFCGMLLC